MLCIYTYLELQTLMFIRANSGKSTLGVCTIEIIIIYNLYYNVNCLQLATSIYHNVVRVKYNKICICTS